MTALIGLVGVLLGVILGKVLEWVIDERRRFDCQIDMIFALHAEISAGFGIESRGKIVPGRMIPK